MSDEWFKMVNIDSITLETIKIIINNFSKVQKRHERSKI